MVMPVLEYTSWKANKLGRVSVYIQSFVSLIVAAFTEAALQIRELFSIRPLFSVLTI